MRKFFLTCAIAVMGLTLPTFAEYCYNAPCETDCCTSGFDGFYVVGNLGVFSNTSYRDDFDGFFPAGGSRSTTSTNVTAGIGIGYDWMCCNNLFGVVADWNWANISHRIDSATSGERHHDSHDWFVTIRGRTGITVCDALFYVTLGAAAFRHETRGDSFHHHNTRWGWVGGVGTEYLLGCNWSLGAELLFLNFDNRTTRFDSAGTTFRIGHSDTAYVGRVILSYRFGNLFCCY